MNAINPGPKARWDYVLLFLLALLVRLLTALPVHHPGYMDAAYSYDIALNLVRGQGFVEPFVWNYLDDPSGLPHPSHLYWMPLPSALAWVGLITLGQSYRAAQIPFAFTAALLPLVGYWVGVQATGRRRHGWLAGLLTLFSGFYVPFWSHTDNFAPFALVGSLSLVAAWQAGRARGKGGNAVGWALAAGALVGLAHLSRCRLGVGGRRAGWAGPPVAGRWPPFVSGHRIGLVPISNLQFRIS
jgi:hypothetical protein